MRYAGAIIGMPFSLEGFAFFTEAIFLGIYLYGWTRVPPRAHLFAGAMVAISGALSGIFVVIANAWMNTPTGFHIVNGRPVDIDPLAAMLASPSPKKKAWLESRWFLRALILAAPLGFIAIETGWVVTEVGRQPWIIYGVMRTAQAVTPVPGLVVPFITFTALYIFLAAITVWLLLRQVAASPQAFGSDGQEVRLAA
jgi:cytochrome bd-type quinol oxidase subunit 1